MKTNLLSLSVALVAACSSPPVAPTVAESPTWVPVTQVELTAAIECPARIAASPTSVAVVTPPFRARVVRVRVRAGDAVVANTPLVDVVMPEVLDAAARFEGAKQKASAWQARVEQLTELRAQGLARSLEVSEAASRLAEAVAEQRLAQATLSVAGLRSADTSAVLSSSTLTLRAPIDGIATEVSAIVGASHEPTGGALVRIVGAGPVRVEARCGQAARDGAWFWQAGAQRLPLHLVSSSLAAERDGTFTSWLEGTGLPAAGTLGRVGLLPTAGREQRFRVDARAITRTNQLAQVTTRRGAVPVEVGPCAGPACEVVGALQADDVVRAGATP